MELEQALACVRAAGFRVSKPQKKNKKARVGPTFVARFADGEVTRMSTFTSLSNLDRARGERLSRAAWATRHQLSCEWTSAQLVEMCPPIVGGYFEQDGVMLATY